MAQSPDDDKFISKLSDADKKIAKDELHERNDEDRKLAVQALRQWINERDWLKSPTDFPFLLRFLRGRKFSQLGAREAIENYWTNKTQTPQWFKNVDPADEDIQYYLRSGYCLAPRQYDKQGRRVCIFRIGKLKMSELVDKSKLDSMYRTNMMILDWLACDEKVQVNGLVTMNDYSGVSMDLMKAFNMEYSKKSMSYFQNCLPIRFKGFNLYQEPAFLDAIMAIMKPFMKKKIIDRMKMHGKSMVGIYEEFGMHVFPDEYLPDDYDGPTAGSIDKIIEEMIEDIMKPKFRNYIRDISSDKFGVDISRKEKTDDAPVASFRKLNVD